jgi:hypothetical protein
MDVRLAAMSMTCGRSAALTVWGLAFIAACAAAPGCWGPKRPTRPPPAAVAPVPAALSGISIHVHRLASPVENDDDRYDYSHMPGYTDGMRAALSTALAQAGYKVVLDRRTPADIVAVVYEELSSPYPEDEPRREGVATVALRDRFGNVLDRLSAPVPMVGQGYDSEALDDHAAAALIEAMGRSEPLLRFAAAKTERGRAMLAAGSPPRWRWTRRGLQ